MRLLFNRKPVNVVNILCRASGNQPLAAFPQRFYECGEPLPAEPVVLTYVTPPPPPPPLCLLIYVNLRQRAATCHQRFISLSKAHDI